MIVLTLYVALVSHPPLGMALRETVFPSNINFAAITTIVGGTVGVTSVMRVLTACSIRASAAKNTSKKFLRRPTAGLLWSASCVMCCFWLFLAWLPVVSPLISPATMQTRLLRHSPAAAGNVGLRIFGIVLWAAALSSVVGAAWTSVSFISVFRPGITERQRNIATLIFIAFTLVVYLCLGYSPRSSAGVCWRVQWPRCFPRG